MYVSIIHTLRVVKPSDRCWAVDENSKGAATSWTITYLFVAMNERDWPAIDTDDSAVAEVHYDGFGGMSRRRTTVSPAVDRRSSSAVS